MRILMVMLVMLLGIWAHADLKSERLVPPPPDAEKSQDPDPDVAIEGVEITTPEDQHESRPKYFYPYLSSLSFVFGGTLSSPEDGSVVSYGLFGASYLWPSSTARHIESGAEGFASGQSDFWTSYRVHWVSTARVRPFWSLGLGVKIFSNRGLASFLEFKNFYIRGAVGFEWSFWNQLSVRTEFFACPDFSGRGFLAATTGISWGFE
ncbi:MAG: hypothetical protein IT289_09085 [Oligoflexia bacterium]|nr:hypothetical protein [Oligoflexia bacterium]